MLLSLLLSSTNSEETLCPRLTNLTDAPVSLRVLRRGGAELALATAWQLAVALGGSPSIETTADQKLHVQVALSLMAPASPCSGNGTGRELVGAN